MWTAVGCISNSKPSKEVNIRSYQGESSVLYNLLC